MAITINTPTNGQTVTLSSNVTGTFDGINAGVFDADGTPGPLKVKIKFDRTDAGTADVIVTADPVGSTFTIPMNAPPLLKNATYDITPTVTDGQYTLTGTKITGVKTT